MMRKKDKKYMYIKPKDKSLSKLLLVVLLVGLLLRLILLGKYPSGFFRDESALGYNAYSLLTTGKDEYGMKFPIFFRSFEVFFLPLYVYLSVPIVGILGLTEFSTRLLSSLSGFVALIVTYLIAKKIWDKKVAIFSAIILAISPWHIFYSRGAFEGNLAITFFAIGFLFWIKFLEKSSTKSFFLSALFFLASMYTYQAERAVVPLLILVALVFSFQKVWNSRKKILLPLVLIFIIFLPLFSFTLKPSSYHRGVGVSIFTKDTPGIIEGLEEGLFVNNRVYLRTRQFLALYTSYFSPRNLFFQGDANQQRTAVNFSVFYPWLFPFLVLGIAKALKEKDKKIHLLVTWMLVAAVPASLAEDPFHTYRSLLLYLPLTVFIGLGISKSFNFIKDGQKIFFGAAFFLISSVSLSHFLFSYFALTPHTYARDWDYGYKQIIHTLDNYHDAKKIVIDDPWTESYIHFLFFAKVNPSSYQKEVEKMGKLKDYYYTSADEIRPVSFRNLEFRKIDWPKERGDSGTIFVVYAKNLPESEFATDPNVELLDEINYPSGEIAYRILKII